MPRLCLTAERHRRRGRERHGEAKAGCSDQRREGAEIFGNGGEVSCTAATGRWLSPGMEAERGRGERGNNETCRGSVVNVLRGGLGTRKHKMSGRKETC